MQKAQYKRLNYILIIVLLFNIVIPILINLEKAYASGTVTYNDAENQFEYRIDVKKRTTDNHYTTTGFRIYYNGQWIEFSSEDNGWGQILN